jgi:hypothetical protein
MEAKMLRMTTVRNFAFVAMLCATLAAMQARVLAMGEEIEDACDAWADGEGYACWHCATGLGWEPDWEAEGSCDFSGIEDEEQRLNTAGAYCDDLWYACIDSCEEGYDDYLAAYFEWAMSETDPCYPAAIEPSNWWTWGQASCEAGETSQWACSCEGAFMGEC